MRRHAANEHRFTLVSGVSGLVVVEGPASVTDEREALGYKDVDVMMEPVTHLFESGILNAGPSELHNQNPQSP